MFKPEKPTNDTFVIEKNIPSKTEKAMIKRVVPSAVFSLHVLIHLLAFVVYWRLAQVEGIPYGTELLLGNLQVERGQGPGIGEAVRDPGQS